MKNKLILIITLLAFLSSSLWAQDDRIQTLSDATSSDGGSFGGFGGPRVMATTLAGQWGVLVGGQGGFIINQMFSIGLMGVGFANKSERDYIGSDDSQQTAIYQMGYGGIFVEYIWNLPSLVHFSIPLDLVAIGVPIKRESDKSKIDTIAMFGVIPRINLEINMTPWLIVAFSGGYRFAFGKENSHLSNTDVWGPEVGLIFKFGYF